MPDKDLQPAGVALTLQFSQASPFGYRIDTMQQPSMETQDQTPISRSRFILGGLIFAAGFLSPLLIPWVTRSDLPASWKTLLSTGLVAGLPEIGMLLAVAVLGKQGFAQLKAMIFAKLRAVTKPTQVSRARYHVGLVMLLAPLALGWLLPYLEHLGVAVPDGHLWIHIVLDVIFASSFIVLGAGFWDKIQGLFRHTPG